MPDAAIQVDGLWKRYHKRFGASTLWSLLGARERTDDEFWALREVSFEVQPGECLGIIGPNGSGKSTLLKVLSRITHATRGRVRVNGRVASMLEVGTGFHSELTGRENVYLSGAIMGMSQAEIRKRFDAIVAFSGVEEFIDVPVKRYSSGMYVRLAFAVAAHVETDILIVDEVLAVGDAEFQKKCMGTMGEEGRRGRTILLVSHNVGAILQACSRALWLQRGTTQQVGSAKDVVKAYVHDSRVPVGEVAFPVPATPSRAWLIRVRVSDRNGLAVPGVAYDSAIRFDIEYNVQQPVEMLRVGCRLTNEDNIAVLQTATSDCPAVTAQVGVAGGHCATVRLPGSLLAPGRYFLDLGIWSPDVGHHQQFRRALAFDVLRPDLDVIGDEVLRPMLNWEVAGR
jgi:lipopolysaccharide transport system ATP-binding protein